MKKWIPVLCALCLLFNGCVQIDAGKMASAAMELGMAASISAEELQDVSRQMRVEGDSKAQVAGSNSKYTTRLNRLLRNHTQVNGIPLNYKVYLTSTVNANASADGSIRVYSGLMDLMDDNELLYVIGHEIGHVANGDSLKAMRVAYTSSAARKGVGSLAPSAAALSESFLGDLLETVINSQYSQNQELDADDFAMRFMQENGYDARGTVSALRKLEQLSSGGGGFFSSHPDSGKRAARMEQALQNYTPPK